MDFTISDDPTWQPEHRNTKRAERRDGPMRFIAVDGEGVTLPDGTHKYVLIGIGDRQLADPDGLDFKRILRFLWDNKPGEHVAVVGFFLGYDFTQWLKTLPEHRARLLLTAEGKASRARRKSGGNRLPYPVEYDEWQFDILGTKRFKFRPRPDCDCVRIVPRTGQKFRPTDCEHTRGIPWMYVCDTGPFFQKSFLKVINPKEWTEPVVTPEEYETILRGKAGRGTDQLDDDMKFYNRLENDCLPRVLHRLDLGFRDLGIRLDTDQWYGPGQAAQAWLDLKIGPKSGQDHTRSALEEIDGWLAMKEYSRMAYYGGWFELFAHGIIPGSTHEYDINSAYPHSIRNLPCLLHGRYTHGTGMPNHRDGDITIVKVALRRKPGCDKIGVMPHREAKGSILRPLITEGWMHWDELQATIRTGIIRPGTSSVKISEWVQYRPCDCPPPLREVADIYELRKKAGKKTPLGIACKLVPNSLYGKFAQSIGHPKYGNAIYASLITSTCRTMILDAIATHPTGVDDVLMIATDGVYFRTPHPSLPISGNLGDWDHDSKENMTLFKPGVYWDDAARKAISDGDTPAFKARGVNARDFASHLESADEQFRHMLTLPKIGELDWPHVDFPVSFAMTTATSAAHQGNWDKAGNVLVNKLLMQQAHPYAKRCCPVVKDGIIVTEAYDYGDGPNVPYDKRFGSDDSPFSEFTRDMLSVNMDGGIGMTIMETLGI